MNADNTKEAIKFVANKIITIALLGGVPMLAVKGSTIEVRNYLRSETSISEGTISQLTYITLKLVEEVSV
jgi:hypothetical protein